MVSYMLMLIYPIRSSILQKGGVLPLGEFFIFSHKSDMTHDILPYTTESATINDSMLSCTYNVYLSNTNLVVQPDVRRLEIRPLSLSDLDKKEGTTTTGKRIGFNDSIQKTLLTFMF